MPQTRRQIVRPTAPAPASASEHRQRLRLRAKFDRARAALDRWHKRLSRAFNAWTKHHKAVVRLERQLAHEEEACRGSSRS